MGWPGNVRELENVMERAVLVCGEGSISEENLFLEGEERSQVIESSQGVEPSVSAVAAGQTLRDMEKNLIFETLKEVKGNKTKASKLLGISVRTMRNKLNEYKIDQFGE